ncbi:uncharacterized protein EV422DRAFT_572380 [Fimicolochytrium jonesii]|uniref:uncharacterized protein n=1 Tax=Fimicolochytrium jonesii TaxID=1396493 RepID=UPI0022FED933|nr:uncharacterized protein EV422DRAFT_572380 [Fimicolochytrium jonesii]KAI8815904.1 hypothetical protein EV422DRAFT_572380 [Fimicolochytrium jonesii]
MLSRLVSLSLTLAVAVSAQPAPSNIDALIAGGPGSGPVVSTLAKTFAKSITEKALYRHLTAFQAAANQGNGTRVFGTPGNDVQLQPFDHLYSIQGPTASTLTFIGGNDTAPINLRWHFYSPSADITNASLVVLPDTFVQKDNVTLASTGCNLNDFRGTDVKGKIVLIRREADREFPCPMENKTRNAAESGAAAVLLYPAPPAVTKPSLFEKIPSASLRPAHVERVLTKINASSVPLKATLHVDSLNEWRKTFNIIATSRWGDAKNIIHVGSHIDSVAEGPGLNDNASGSSTILEVALRIARYPTRNKLRFSWWNAEEAGLIGAKYYVANLTPREKAATKLYLNFDMTGSPNFILGVHDGDNSSGGNNPSTIPAGSFAIETVFRDYAKSVNQTVIDYALSGGSDYDPFLRAGIPVGGLATGASGLKTEENAAIFGGTAGVAHDECYHEACDTIENVSLKAMTFCTKALAYAAVRFAYGDVFTLTDEVI